MLCQVELPTNGVLLVAIESFGSLRLTSGSGLYLDLRLRGNELRVSHDGGVSNYMCVDPLEGIIELHMDALEINLSGLPDFSSMVFGGGRRTLEFYLPDASDCLGLLTKTGYRQL